MALPSSYTESQLRDYMLATVSTVASIIDVTAVAFAESVNDVLLAYGVTDIASATDIAKLRSLARVYAWRYVADATVGEYNFSADGGTYSRQQLHEQATKALARAEAEAAQAGFLDSGAPSISLTTLTHTDPYLTDESLY